LPCVPASETNRLCYTHAYKLFIAGLSTSPEPEQTRYEKNVYDLTSYATAKEANLHYSASASVVLVDSATDSGQTATHIYQGLLPDH